jgi:coenzyme PQQ precursor peptide PqqA
MGGGLPAGTADGDHVCSSHKETDMKWQTPTAQDFRFGFEITMYIAAR